MTNLNYVYFCLNYISHYYGKTHDTFVRHYENRIFSAHDMLVFPDLAPTLISVCPRL